MGVGYVPCTGLIAALGGGLCAERDWDSTQLCIGGEKLYLKHYFPTGAMRRFNMDNTIVCYNCGIKGHKAASCKKGSKDGNRNKSPVGSQYRPTGKVIESIADAVSKLQGTIDASIELNKDRQAEERRIKEEKERAKREEDEAAEETRREEEEASMRYMAMQLDFTYVRRRNWSDIFRPVAIGLLAGAVVAGGLYANRLIGGVRVTTNVVDHVVKPLGVVQWERATGLEFFVEPKKIITPLYRAPKFNFGSTFTLFSSVVGFYAYKLRRALSPHTQLKFVRFVESSGDGFESVKNGILPGDFDLRPHAIASTAVKHWDPIFTVLEYVDKRPKLVRWFLNDERREVVISFELLTQIMTLRNLNPMLKDEDVWEALTRSASHCHIINLARADTALLNILQDTIEAAVHIFKCQRLRDSDPRLFRPPQRV